MLHHRQRGALLGESLDPQVSKKSAFYFLAVFAISGGTSMLYVYMCAFVCVRGRDKAIKNEIM